MSSEAERAQERESLITMVSQCYPNYQPDDLRLFATDNLRILLNDYKKMHPETPVKASFTPALPPRLQQPITPTAAIDVMQLLEQIYACLDRDVDLQGKIRTVQEQLTSLHHTLVFSQMESELIQKDIHKHLFSLILRSYHIRQDMLQQCITQKFLSAETEKVLSNNQQALGYLLNQYAKWLS
jgi:hypothetical protein